MEKDECSHEDLRAEIREIKETLQPIAEAFVAVSKFGAWGKSLLVIFSIIVSLILGVRAIFAK